MLLNTFYFQKMPFFIFLFK